jgi:hypothetical protein
VRLSDTGEAMAIGQSIARPVSAPDPGRIVEVEPTRSAALTTHTAAANLPDFGRFIDVLVRSAAVQIFGVRSRLVMGAMAVTSQRVPSRCRVRRQDRYRSDGMFLLSGLVEVELV